MQSRWVQTKRIISETYLVWSETNAQGEISCIQILKTPWFWAFFRPSLCRFRRVFRSNPSTSEGWRQTRLWRWFRLPQISLSWWWCPWTATCQSALTSLSDTETSPLGRYLANRVGSNMDCGIVPVQKPVLEQQSGLFSVEIPGN